MGSHNPSVPHPSEAKQVTSEEVSGVQSGQHRQGGAASHGHQPSQNSADLIPPAAAPPCPWPHLLSHVKYNLTGSF